MAEVKACVLDSGLDQSHHMVEQYVEGPDAIRMLSHLPGPGIWDNVKP